MKYHMLSRQGAAHTAGHQHDRELWQQTMNGGELKHRLKLKGVLGRGAFGQIHKGILDGEVVAVKTMITESHRGENDINSEMFFREARILRACSHKRIIGYRTLVKLPPTSLQSTQPVWALIMEYAQSGSLSQRIVQQMIHPGSQQYSAVQAISWALDVACALEYLHMRTPAVLHRDVKSANVLLTTEEGSLVAKLSDFGLHVAADTSKYSTVHASSSSVAAKDGPSLTTVPVQAGPSTDSSSGASKTLSSSSSSTAHGNTSGDTLNPAPVQAHSSEPAGTAASRTAATASTPGSSECSALRLQPSTADASARVDSSAVYSEVHDSRGSQIFVGSHTAAAAAALQQDGSYGASSMGSEGSANRRPVRRSSFKRAVHHPPGEALPRVSSSGGAAGPGDGGVSADTNAQLFAQLRAAGGGAADDEDCASLTVTQGTWNTGSDCTDDTAGSICEEQETVFNMTGHTGSCLYMAPEVFLGQRYNEKSDVFSFGVVLYELMARTLVMFTELPTNSSDVARRYAEKVAGGYRPQPPKAMSAAMWHLISACWQQDPLLRPHMTEVVSVLSTMLADKLATPTAPRSQRWRNFSRGPRAGTPSTPSTPDRCIDGTSDTQGTVSHGQPGAQGDEGARCTDQAGGVQVRALPEQAAKGCGCVIC